MLRTLCIFIISILPFFAFSQQETADIDTLHNKKHFFNEVGVNGTYIISQFLNLNDDDILQSPYLLTFKRGINKSALRFGFGADYKETESSIDGFDDNQVDKELRIDTRIGYEYQADFGKKWIGYFGGDFTFFFQDDQLVSNSNFDIVTLRTKIWGVGIGPVIGTQFKINDRLMIGTEGAFYFVFSESKATNTFSNFPEFDTDAEIEKNKEILNYLPSTLYLIFHF